MGQVKYIYMSIEKVICDLCLIVVAILTLIVTILTLTLTVRRGNENMVIESSYATSYLTAVVMLALSVFILEIFAVKMCQTLTLAKDQGQIYITKSKTHM